MSAKSRAEKCIQLPIAPEDSINGVHEADDVLVVQCVSGRLFMVERVTRYKRKFKVREVPPIPRHQNHNE